MSSESQRDVDEDVSTHRSSAAFLAQILEANISVDQWVGYVPVSGGEPRLAAYVVPQPGIQLGSIQPPAGWLGCVIFVERLPMGEDGEVDERELSSWPVVDGACARGWLGRARLAHPASPEATLVAESNQQASMAPERAPTARVGPSAIIERTPCPRVGEKIDLRQVLRRAAEDGPGGLTSIDRDGTREVLPYARLLRLAANGGAFLRQRFGPARRKALLLLEAPGDVAVAFWCCVMARIPPAILALTVEGLEGESSRERVRHTWATLDREILITSARLRPRLLEVLGQDAARWIIAIDELRGASSSPLEEVEVAPDEVAAFILTSGSTGRANAVIHTHASLVGLCRGAEQGLELREDDVTLNWMAMDHAGSVVMMHLLPMYVHCSLVLVDPAYVLADPVRWVSLMHELRATVTWAPNFAFRLVNGCSERLLSTGYDLSRLRRVINGGEAIISSTLERALEVLTRLGMRASAMVFAWGMAETASGSVFKLEAGGNARCHAGAFANLGCPVDGLSLRIVGDQDEPLVEGQVGHLQAKGVPITQGYWNNPEHTKRSFTADGWFRTGDLAALRDRQMIMVGRGKDVVIINGANYYCHEIEAAAETVAGVEPSFTAALGIPDLDSGSEGLVVVFAVAEAWRGDVDAVASNIRSAIMRDIGVNPTAIHPLRRDEVPKTSIGKIQRGQLRQRFQQAGGLQHAARGGAVSRRPTMARERWIRREASGDWLDGSRPASLVIADGAGLATALCNTSSGASEVFAAVTMEAWLSDASRSGVGFHQAGQQARWVVLATYGRDDRGGLAWEDAGRLRGDLTARFFPLRTLLRSLGTAHGGPAEIVVVTARACATQAGERVDPVSSAIGGLVRAAGVETPWRRIRHVDLEGRDVAEDARVLAGELEVRSSARVVAYRGGRRLVPELVLARAQGESLRDSLPIQGRYVVAGGAGGLGALAIREIARHVGGRFLVLGRTVLDGRVDEARPSRLSSNLQALRAAGIDVTYRAVPIEDPARVESSVAEWERECGGLVECVIHSAGVADLSRLSALEEHLVHNEQDAAYWEQFRAKVFGTAALASLLERRAGAKLVSFGSIATFRPTPGFSAYIAANSAQRGLMQDLVAGGRSALSLHWSMWDELGMSRDAGKESKGALVRGGLELLKVDAVAASVPSLIGGSGSEVLVGVDLSGPREDALQHAVAAPGWSIDVKGASTSATLTVQDALGRSVAVSVEVGSRAVGPHGRRLAIATAAFPVAWSDRVPEVRLPLRDRPLLERQIASVCARAMGVGGGDLCGDLGQLTLWADQVREVGLALGGVFRCNIPLQAVRYCSDLSQVAEVVRANESRPGLVDRISGLLGEVGM